jgi:fructose-bisphosphate aldolase class I
MSEFIAAMDHSGGSTGGVLERYGQEYTEEDKMRKVHDMRLRMVNSPEFTSNNIGGAILYKDTIERGMVPILEEKGIHIFLKIDSGCEENGMLKDFDCDAMIEFAKLHRCDGTKMRSIVKDERDLDKILDQQFSLATQIVKDSEMLPIIEPEIPIDHPDKENLEQLLLLGLQERLDWIYKSEAWFKSRSSTWRVPRSGLCMLKLTLPEKPDLYHSLSMHTNVHRVLGLSGGYSTTEACRRLSMNKDMRASFSRALSEGLSYSLTDDEFNAKITQNIKDIEKASG